MKKKALRKDFYMEIRRSLGRFMSIFFIVAIGCSFFSGIRASEPDMRYSGDAYFDEKNMMDIEVISTLGLTDDDLQAIKDVDGVSAAEGSYSVDVLCSEGDNQIAVHVMSLLPEMNQVQLEGGRLPEAEDECAVDVDYLNESSLEIGDEITFSSGSDDDITDTLKTDTFTITGTVSSPNYISFQRGSTTIGNGSLAAFIVVPEDSFSLDVYTEIYAQVDGAKEMTAFTDAYDDRVQEAMDAIEAIQAEREQIRYDEIVDEANEALEDARQQVSDAETELEDGKAQAEAELADARQQLDDAQEEVDSGWQEIESSREQLESSRQQLVDSQAEVDRGQEELNANIDALNQQIDELNAAKEEYNSLAASGATDDVTMATLNAMYEEIQKGEAAIAQAQDQIDSAKAELESGQDQINSGWNQITAGEQELADAEAKLEEAEAEIADGWEEYYEGEAEAEAEIADGEQKIADAKEELADAENEINDIEMPEWYIYDRSNLPDYTGYGENADRMRAIGEVFPAIFFLVAALISLTTMTRMVEEQRTQIGTLKALGYERHSIAGKYLGYALLATVSGSVVGILFGEKVFPYIIINAYGIMYQHMNDIVIPYNLEYGLGAAAAALASTLLATVFSCYKELREQAAELMRPPTPKQGQRVMLERVKFIWKRLNFSWKASIRNLVRYKKRLFMTIFGIGGCMALMLVGFGLKDSIFAIVDIQYGEIQLYDGNIILSDDATEEEKSNIITTLEKDSKMAGSTEGILSQITVGNGEEWHDVYLDVPKNVEEFSEFVVLQDRVTNEKYELDDSGAILTEKMATELDVEPGDTVTIRDENRGDLEVEISAVCENYMSHYLYMTPAYYEKVYGEQPDYNSIFYKTADRITEEAERIGEEALTLPGALSVSYTTDLREQVDNMLGALDEVIVVLIISAGMLAFVVLYNLNNINITERQRELATLKVLGFYNGEVAMYVYRENIVLTVLGAVFGIVLGKFLHGFIIVTVEIESVMFGRNIDLSSFIYGFLLTILFSLLVNGAMYFKLKKINMVESLKSVE
ncbi:FtsX-like permease family protein [Mediterraneibacter glycyrrhizinilyticus]|uniref:FtsX-like permease family protein n=1 Tax=Mediterraneibacter glycyrrhizinilyticus TaxID=342942 RepID=UPI0025A35DD7|nr:FtsX-like permease family protein [Mediterraneibacter glycyrrhizinilyticus]MDM8210701.1 FtsX-like permease family protein [Mediterraneibacter glycyrrhizinilyticus]